MFCYINNFSAANPHASAACAPISAAWTPILQAWKPRGVLLAFNEPHHYSMCHSIWLLLPTSYIAVTSYAVELAITIAVPLRPFLLHYVCACLCVSRASVQRQHWPPMQQAADDNGSGRLRLLFSFCASSDGRLTHSMITGAAATAIADFGASCMCRLRDRQTEMRILYYEAHWEFSVLRMMNSKSFTNSEIW